MRHPYMEQEISKPQLTTEYCHKATQQVVKDMSEHYPVVFGTIHGSYLYGTAHGASDVDFLVVVESGNNKSKVVNGVDVQIYNLKTFTRLVALGSHQSIEALYSPYKVFTNTVFRSLVEHMTVSSLHYYGKCLSAAHSFAARALEDNNVKAARHAYRLHNAAERALEHGDFSPVWRHYEPFTKKEDEQYFQHAEQLLIYMSQS